MFSCPKTWLDAEAVSMESGVGAIVREAEGGVPLTPGPLRENVMVPAVDPVENAAAAAPEISACWLPAATEKGSSRVLPLKNTMVESSGRFGAGENARLIYPAAPHTEGDASAIDTVCCCALAIFAASKTNEAGGSGGVTPLPLKPYWLE